MNDKALFCTLNGIHELSGGGLYARNICNYISRKSKLLAIYCKNTNEDSMESNHNDIEVYHLNKNPFVDLVSRIFLSPSFLVFYSFLILLHIRRFNPDTVYLHNSRNGILGLLIKLFFRTKIIICFDNVESKLSKMNISSKGIKGLISAVDFVLCKISDYLSFKVASKCLFITKQDRDYFIERYGNIDTEILPIKIPLKNYKKVDKEDIDILFTGTFNFYPNEAAFIELICIANKLTDKKFVIAGRASYDMKRYMPPKNIILIDSPSSDDMQSLFCRARLYVSPVKIGSGMKTKVAEAMSFGLPVVCSEHSLIGYDDIDDVSFIAKAESIEQYVNKISYFLSLKDEELELLKDDSYRAFGKYYSF